MRDRPGDMDLPGLTVAQREQLRRFAVELRASPHNLMSSRAMDELWTRHVPECLELARRLPDGPLEIADVGAGGGFPGIVIAVARPAAAVALIESTGKKARFLRVVAQQIGLEVTVINERAEDLGDTRWAHRFDAVTARAVAPLRELIPWTLPLLAEGGLLYAVKGQRWEEEVQEARRELGDAAFDVVESPAEHERNTDLAPRIVILTAGDPGPEEDATP